MLYGANGYTGALIAREARARGLSPVLAGRDAGKIGALATELGLEARVFGSGDADEIAGHLSGVSLVLHCAGPFSATSAPMVEACLRHIDFLDVEVATDVQDNYRGKKGDMAVFFNIVEGPQYFVHELTVEGIEHLDKASIMSVLSSAPRPSASERAATSSAWTMPPSRAAIRAAAVIASRAHFASCAATSTLSPRRGSSTPLSLVPKTSLIASTGHASTHAP